MVDHGLMGDRTEYGRWDGYQWVRFDPADVEGPSRRQMRTLNIWIGLIAILMLIWSIFGAYALVRINHDAHHPSCIIGDTC